MSIATEISRLQAAKADIKAAIEAKGVTVPAAAKLDTYDDYVAQISGGGGVIQPLTVTEDGIYTPPSGVDGYAPVTVRTAEKPYDAQVEWICNATLSEYLLIGFMGNGNCTIEIATTGLLPGVSFITGSRITYNTAQVALLNLNASSGLRYDWGAVNNNKYATPLSYLDGGDHIFALNSQGQCYADGTLLHTYSAASFANSYPLCIFGVNSAGTINKAESAFKLRSFVLKISGIVVRDMIPVRIGSVGYMYDKVFGELFGNEGGGAFTFGNDV